MKIVLNSEEIKRAEEIAHQWDVVQGEEVYKIKWGQKQVKTLDDTIQGVCCEMAVAKALNIPYDGDIGIVGGFDIGGKYEVRGTGYASGCLLLHPEDKEAPYILVIVSETAFDVVGWIMASDGKKPEYWRTDVRYPCYFVPQVKLKSIESLI
jgi:hypothetical protein